MAVAWDVEARGFALCLARTLAAFAPLPVFGQGVSARFAKLGLGAALAWSCLRVGGAAAVADPGPEPLAMTVALFPEVLFGLLMGWTARLVLDVCKLAGVLISHEMGLNLANQLDPAGGGTTPLIGHLYDSAALVLFFALGAHRDVVEATFRSFRAAPPGKAPDLERLTPALLGFAGGLLEAALRLAAPVFFALILVSVLLALFAKVAPQWHLLEAAYPLRAGVALVLIGLCAPLLAPAVHEATDACRATLQALTAPE